MRRKLAPSRREQQGPGDRGASAFEEAGGFTVGLEEELILLDPGTLDPTPAASEVLRLLDGDERFAGELKRAQLEIDTPPSRTVGGAVRELAAARRELVDRLAGSLRLAAVGTHPRRETLGDVSPGDRYRALLDEYQWLARGAIGCGLHVHVAAGGAERSVAVFDAARSHLPELAALSANSPFRGGEDTGLASIRQLGETFPRTGVPPAFGDWDGLVRYLEWGRRGALFPDGTHVWWDLRLGLAHGTIELRVCDAQTRVADSGALAALFACVVAELSARFDAGERLPARPAHLIAENAWRALRHGVRASFVDLDTGEQQPARERIAALVERLAPTAERLGCAAELEGVDALLRETGADRQRAAAGRGGIDAVLRQLVEETEAPAAD